MKCPGQDTRYWKPEDIFETPCPHCGTAMEFWKDDPRRKCKQCGHMVRNPQIDLGCAEWCAYAKQCLGVDVLPGTDRSLCEALLAEMKGVFGDDDRRIKHAHEVLDYAEKIHAAEGGDPLVVKAAAILHDVGIREAERKHGSSAEKFQELEGPAIARQILEKHGVDPERIKHICRIVGGRHSGEGNDSVESMIVWDADQLANFREECAGGSPAELRRLIRTVLRTDAGRAIAEEQFLSENPTRRGEQEERE